MIQELARVIGKSYATADFAKRHPIGAVELSAKRVGDIFLRSPLNPLTCWVFDTQRTVQSYSGRGTHIETYTLVVPSKSDIPPDATGKEFISDGTPFGGPYESTNPAGGWFQTVHTCIPSERTLLVGYRGILIQCKEIEVPAPK